MSTPHMQHSTPPAVPQRPVVYIASPYTRGDQSINTRFQCEMFDRMMSDGKVWPYAPLWSHFQHGVFPRAYQEWIDYDLALCQRFDACLRLDATFKGGGLDYSQHESSGADGEVASFLRQGKPVFYSIEDLYKWVGTFTGVAL